MGINKGLGDPKRNTGFYGKAGSFSVAINNHNLFLLSKAIIESYSDPLANTKVKLINFLKTQKIKDYYKDVHCNNQNDLDKV